MIVSGEARSIGDRRRRSRPAVGRLRASLRSIGPKFNEHVDRFAVLVASHASPDYSAALRASGLTARSTRGLTSPIISSIERIAAL